MAARLLHVLPALDLREVEKEEHGHKEGVEWPTRAFHDLVILIPSWDWEVKYVWDEHASYTKHGPATILELSITVPVGLTSERSVM